MLSVLNPQLVSTGGSSCIRLESWLSN